MCSTICRSGLELTLYVMDDMILWYAYHFEVIRLVTYFFFLLHNMINNSQWCHCGPVLNGNQRYLEPTWFPYSIICQCSGEMNQKHLRGLKVSRLFMMSMKLEEVKDNRESFCRNLILSWHLSSFTSFILKKSSFILWDQEENSIE